MASSPIDDRDALDRAFRRLSIEQRAVFVLHHHVGLPLTEIADTLGIPAGTARSRLHYATRVLRAAVEADAAPSRPRRTDGMTTERDFDRLARAWLELGPDEAPDRVVAAVLQAAETTPQVRRPIGWSIWRSFHMNRLSIAAIAVVLVVVVGGGILLTRSSDQGVVGAPTTTPSPSAERDPLGERRGWRGADGPRRHAGWVVRGP